MSEGSIFVVDQNEGSRRAMAELLRGAGYEVESFADPAQALSALSRGGVKMVVADASGNHGAGPETVSLFKAGNPDLPVILTSSCGDVAGALDAIKAGASEYLLKPLSKDIVELAVKRCLLSGNGSGRAENAPSRTRREKRIVTQDPGFQKVLKAALTVARSGATVLIQGESGTGKELLADFIHMNSDRRNGPYVALNCAALPENLAESELFGHEKGAFTGAVARKPGRFELAHRGSLVLDEISEMPLSIQAKLLRVLQEREVERVGGTRPVPVDVRVIAISNKDLKAAVRDKRFREDLFYRIHVVPLVIPPLRERRGDIRLLASYFLEKTAGVNGTRAKEISPEALKTLEAMEWKGNVRELENVIERAALLCEEEVIRPHHLMFDSLETQDRASPLLPAGMSMKEMERLLISSTLKEVNGNRTHAARMLGISIRTLRNKLREYREGLCAVG
jgi:two-component system response regulator FlrC